MTTPSKITKIRSGKIYFNHFDGDYLEDFWTVSPAVPEAYSMTARAGWLRVNHTNSEEPTRILFDVPSASSLVIEIKNEYYPVKENDSGGLTAFQEIRNKIELLEYFDGTTGTSVNYTHMRIKKKGNTFEGYGSKDGGRTWNIIGAKTTRDMEKIGLVLYGDTSAGHVPMDIDYLAMYKDSHIHVQNLQPGVKVELFDESGVYMSGAQVSRGEDRARLDCSMTTMPFRGFVRVTYADGTHRNSDLQEMWGGDVFWDGIRIDFYINDKKLDVSNDFDLGEMPKGLIEVPVEVENPTEEVISDIYLEVKDYEFYYGHQWVQISQDEYGVPGKYQKKIYIGTIQPGERHFFWLRVRRVPVEQEAQWGPYKFRLIAYNQPNEEVSDGN